MPSKKSGKRSGKKEVPSMIFNCKFRGKFDVNKHKTNKQLDLNNAQNLFDVIYNKNEKLKKDSKIKLYAKSKAFSFSDKKTVRTISHRVPYMQVVKFFIFQRDLKTVIVGVHHKTHKWFLIFQFNTEDDATRFCDEIEQEKKRLDQDIQVSPEFVTDETMTNIVPETEEHVNKHDSVDDSFYRENIELEIEPTTMNTEESFVNQSTSSSSSSSSDNEEGFDENLHCDDMNHSRLNDLYIDSNKRIYSGGDEWKEELTCIEYPKETRDLVLNKNGPVYLYSAHQQVTRSQVAQHKVGYCSDDTDDEEFVQYQPKLIKSQNNNKEEANRSYNKEDASYDRTDSYQHFEPKMVYLN